MAARRALGHAADALDELVPTTAPIAPAAAKKDRRNVVKLPAAVNQEARNAVWFLRRHGHIHATLAGLVHDALREKLDRLKADLNDGRDFPDGDGPLPAGRPLGR